ncbi:MAG TPA: FtsX-like permease family protein [Armatimonadota bacterium]|nr:FtsX-like permease family protein [Armatimonadota bacterium]
MRAKIYHIQYWLLGIAIAAMVAVSSHVAFAATGQFSADCQVLTRYGNRLPGSPGGQKAVNYIAERLQVIGVDQVIKQPFPTEVLSVQRCDITLGNSRVLPLYPMRSDGIIPPITPPEGITGELLYAGLGRATDYGNRSANGKIVVLDYNAGSAWMRAFRMGAQAVIFVHNGMESSRAFHYTEAPANFPRYYFAGSPKQLIEGAKATVHCNMTWQSGVAQNVIGFIRGASPNGPLGHEALLLAANLDTYGEVPALTPGARTAANCAALLKLAASFKAKRPNRDIVLVFFDDEAHGHAGSSAFYRALDTTTPLLAMSERQKAVKFEQSFTRRELSLLQSPQAFTRNSSIYNTVNMRMKQQAANHVYDINAQLEDLNKIQLQLASKKGDVRYQRAKQQSAVLSKAKDPWNDLRRALAHDDIATLRSKRLSPIFEQLISEVRAQVQQRAQELQLAHETLMADKSIQDILGKSAITVHTALLLGDTTSRWGLILGGDSQFHWQEDMSGLYGKVQGAFLDAANQLEANGHGVPSFEKATADGKLNTRLFWEAPLVHSGDIAGRLGIYNLALGTVQEWLPLEGTPSDTPNHINIGRIESQADGIATLVGALASHRSLSVPRTIRVDKSYLLSQVQSDGSIVGPKVMGFGGGSAMPNTPMPGTIIQVWLKPPVQFTYKTNKIFGYDDFQVLMADSNASYSWGPFPGGSFFGDFRAFAAKFNDRGEVVAVSDMNSSKNAVSRINIFTCAGTAVKDGTVHYAQRTGAEILTPQVDAGDTQVLQGISSGTLNQAKAYYGTFDGIVFWYCEKQIEDIKLFGIQSIVALDNGPDHAGGAVSEQTVGGNGFSLIQPWIYQPSIIRSAADLWRLNEYRMDLLRKRGVMNSSLEELHGMSDDLLNAAGRANDQASKESLAASSYLTERPVYNEVRTSLDDLVRAVLILLALAIPFAFALERLLLCNSNIYRQIVWFCIFFLLTFFILFLVHPAFAVSNQPVVIFLAFTLVVLSGLVIFLIMQKFETELKVLQGQTSTVHNADVSRFSTMMAAMGMGISTMRRRPLRTALTAVTIILLTFTILNFASFDTQLGIVTLFEGESPKYSGVFLHKTNWGALDPELLSIINGRWGNTAQVTTRYWLPADTQANAVSPGLLVTHADGSNPADLKGVLGINPDELDNREDIRSALKTTSTALGNNGICLTKTLADSMGVALGDEVLLGGHRLKVVGLMDSATTADAKDMDGNGILPVDFSVATSSQAPPANQQISTGADVLAAAQSKQDWLELPVDKLVVVSSDTAKLIGASLRAITLYTKDTADSVSISENLARMLPLPIVGTRTDGIYTHVLAPKVKATGIKDLIFPILLGGLVIFGTMLGSVADREKEIYTFSALGLAPTHITTLFLAEAMVYSFVGGLGGYLLAQGFMKLMNLLAQYGLVQLPEMNYSSFNAIITILIVMGTVLVSAIYPAFKASRSANPGVLRSWKLPQPVGDHFEMVFPFTVSSYDLTGVVSFLKEHFDNFAETGLGSFMAKDTKLLQYEGSYKFTSHLALAPFDLGVTQSFSLYSVPSEIPGIDEVKIDIMRLSGQQNDWQRLNKVLLDDLRRQFLIWRSLTQETMEMYRLRTMTTTGQEGEEGVSQPTPSVPQTI